ncbi:glycosyltransferase family 2 protein [Geminocystis sp. CENA526]|uniref:glycosyltransferase family 2 protein n=1 Tax=Geminocystis sp. CENA526 TaxID=1355871 RepID=UPI003D6ED4D5
MKLVSVIVPVYNVEAYIAQAINSVLSQTYPHFELLIIDDEGNDRTMDICRQFEDYRIRIISQKNRGLAGARNTGIRHSQGEYLAFLDGDDMWMPDKLAKHIEHLESHPEVGVSFSRSAFIDNQDKLLGTYQMPRLENITAEHLFYENSIGNGSAPVIRREVFEEICFPDNRHGEVENFYFDEDFRRSEDLECWIRIVLQTSWKIEGFSDTLTLYRVNQQGLSANVFPQLASWEQVINKTRSYAPDLIDRCEKPAKAHQLLYLARQAIKFKDGKTAVQLINQAFSTYNKILFTNTRVTVLTSIVGYLLYLLPSPLYNFLEFWGLKLNGFIQKSAIKRKKN